MFRFLHILIIGRENVISILAVFVDDTHMMFIVVIGFNKPLLNPLEDDSLKKTIIHVSNIVMH